jgi:hypothetical protein
MNNSSKFKAVVATVAFPFLWALLGTMLYKVMTMLNDGIPDPNNKIGAGFVAIIILIVSYVIFFTPED